MSSKQLLLSAVAVMGVGLGIGFSQPASGFIGDRQCFWACDAAYDSCMAVADRDCKMGPSYGYCMEVKWRQCLRSHALCNEDCDTSGFPTS